MRVGEDTLGDYSGIYIYRLIMNRISTGIGRPGAKQLAGLSALCLLLLAAGCGDFFVYPGSTGNGSSTGSDFVYVANQTAKTLAAYSVASGALSPLSGSPYTLSFAPTAAVVNPANTMLFVAGADAGVGYIASYSISSNGALTLLNTSNTGLADPISMEVSPDGKWLIGLDGNGITLDEYQINAASGTLTLGNGQSYLIPKSVVVPRAIKISPGGNFIFAAIGTAGDLIFPFDTSTGTISNPTQLSLPSNVSDNALAVSPSGNTLYIARSGSNGGLAAYSISSTGVLQALTTNPYAAGSQPLAVVVTGNGNNVYVANQGDGTISGYTIASNSTATPTSGSPYSNASGPSGLAIDSSGKYLLSISNAGSPDLTLFAFDTATPGKLNLIASTSTGTDPTGPISIAATH